MMKVLRLIPIVLFLFSCTKKTANLPIKPLSVEPIEIPISSNFNPDRTRSQFIESDTGDYLAVLNKIQFSIGIFDLEKKKLVQTIQLEKEGPNGIGLDNGFHLLNKDTLLVATIPPKIRVLNFRGEILNSISVQNSSNTVNFLSSNNETPFLFDQKKLYGIQPFLENFFDINEEDALEVKPIYEVELDEPNLPTEWFSSYRPKGFWREGKKDENLSWTDRYDSIIVAPYSDHTISIISKKTRKLITRKAVKSNLVKEFQILDRNMLGGDRGIIENLTHDRYEIILYDRYRDVFYRFFFPGLQAELYPLSPRQLLANRPLLGVLVLDKNLDVIGEHIFNSHQVQSWNYFVGRKGLYVSTNNPNRDDFDENVLRYDIIRFEGLEYED